MREVSIGTQIVVGLMLPGTSAIKRGNCTEAGREHLGSAPAHWGLVTFMELIRCLACCPASRTHLRRGGEGGVVSLLMGVLDIHLRAGDVSAILTGPALVLGLALCVATIHARSPQRCPATGAGYQASQFGKITGNKQVRK